MLLQRLVEWATNNHAEMPAHYALRPVRWAVDLDDEGVLIGPPIDLGRQTILAPSVARTSGVWPSLAVDTAEYVFGWAGKGAKHDGVGKRHHAFVDLIDQWSTSEPDGPGQAIAAFYRKNHAASVTQPVDWRRGDLFAFRLNNRFACEDASAIRFWSKVVAARKGSSRVGMCLVCRRNKPLMNKIPQQIPRAALAAAHQNATLISVNEATHGYNLEPSLRLAPLCADCSSSFMAALTELLSRAQRHRVLPIGRTRLVSWVTGDFHFDPMLALQQAQGDTTGQTARASLPAAENSGVDPRLYVVALGANTARAIVREWIDMPLADARDNIEEWFRDHQIVDSRTGHLAHLPLTDLAIATGTFRLANSRDLGSRRPAGTFHDRSETIERMVSAALLNEPLPHQLLIETVRRIRLNGDVDLPCTALIRLALRRNPLLAHERRHITPTLDLRYRNVYYLCGRILAMLDGLQRAAIGPRGSTAASRFLRQYLPQVLINPSLTVRIKQAPSTNGWLNQLRKSSRRAILADLYERYIHSLCAHLAKSGGPPTTAITTDQAILILGYHHQRAQLRILATSAQAEDAAETKPTHEAEPSVRGT